MSPDPVGLEKVQSMSKENMTVHKDRQSPWRRDERKGCRKLGGERALSESKAGRSSFWERKEYLSHDHALSLAGCVTLGKPVMSLSCVPSYHMGESCLPLSLTGLCDTAGAPEETSPYLPSLSRYLVHSSVPAKHWQVQTGNSFSWVWERRKNTHSTCQGGSVSHTRQCRYSPSPRGSRVIPWIPGERRLPYPTINHSPCHSTDAGGGTPAPKAYARFLCQTPLTPQPTSFKQALWLHSEHGEERR